MIRAILVFVFLWVCSFLFHELMHIKGQGWRQTGWIEVEELSMRANTIPYYGDEWFLLSGGFLTALAFFVASFLTADVLWQWSLLTIALTQLSYGVFEWQFLRKLSPVRYKIGRYAIYITVPLFMFLVCAQ